MIAFYCVNNGFRLPLLAVMGSTWFPRFR